MRLLILLLLLTNSVLGQIRDNKCDSTILSKNEYEKCLGDSVYLLDISHKVNFISKFKTEVLPNYRRERMKLLLSGEIKKAIGDLKEVYDSVLMFRMSKLLDLADSNRFYVQPKGYLSIVLSFEHFKFYPDVYAVLLNELHTILEPKTKLSELVRYLDLVAKVIVLIPEELEKEIIKSATEIYDVKLKNKENYLFFGSPANRLKELNLVNYLMWSE